MLPDRVQSPLRVLFVGINPGMRSAAIGHHFAGYSNRFWKLLYESNLVPRPLGSADDVRLPEWGYGITNLVPRATPGIDSLDDNEYVAGLPILRRKVRRWKPEILALVGVTLYRAIYDAPFSGLGLQAVPFEGARVYVLPNPSGRNSHYSYPQMLTAFRGLAAALAAAPSSSDVHRGARYAREHRLRKHEQPVKSARHVRTRSE
jgi:TDG/mug DNA glycosylase family protein